MSRHNSITTQQCHNTTVSQHNSVTTQQCHNTTMSQLNSATKQQCHNSKPVIFQKLLNVLKCYNFLWVQRRHNCSPAAGFANCVMTLHLLNVHQQTFLSIPVTQKCQLLSCDTLVANERYVNFIPVVYYLVILLHSLVMASTKAKTCSRLLSYVLKYMLIAPDWICNRCSNSKHRLYSQRINTNLLHCIIYLLVSSPTCFALT